MAVTNMVFDLNGVTQVLTWPEWKEFCVEQNMDPVENCEMGFDLGDGDSFTVACYEIPDELAHLEEVQRREDEFSRRRWRG